MEVLFMNLKDSAALTYAVKPQMFTISILCNEPNAETKKTIEKTDAGIDVAKFKSVKSFMADLRN
jgi:hypothetical protein